MIVVDEVWIVIVALLGGLILYLLGKMPGKTWNLNATSGDISQMSDRELKDHGMKTRSEIRDFVKQPGTSEHIASFVVLIYIVGVPLAFILWAVL